MADFCAILRLQVSLDSPFCFHKRYQHFVELAAKLASTFLTHTAIQPFAQCPHVLQRTLDKRFVRTSCATKALENLDCMDSFHAIVVKHIPRQ